MSKESIKRKVAAPRNLKQPPPEHQELWQSFVRDVRAAAAQYIGDRQLPITPYSAHDIPKLDRFLNGILKSMPTNTHAQFVVVRGKLMVECW